MPVADASSAAESAAEWTEEEIEIAIALGWCPAAQSVLCRRSLS